MPDPPDSMTTFAAQVLAVLQDQRARVLKSWRARGQTYAVFGVPAKPKM